MSSGRSTDRPWNRELTRGPSWCAEEALEARHMVVAGKPVDRNSALGAGGENRGAHQRTDYPDRWTIRRIFFPTSEYVATGPG